MKKIILSTISILILIFSQNISFAARGDNSEGNNVGCERRGCGGGGSGSGSGSVCIKWSTRQVDNWVAGPLIEKERILPDFLDCSNNQNRFADFTSGCSIISGKTEKFYIPGPQINQPYNENYCASYSSGGRTESGR